MNPWDEYIKQMLGLYGANLSEDQKQKLKQFYPDMSFDSPAITTPPKTLSDEVKLTDQELSNTSIAGRDDPRVQGAGREAMSKAKNRFGRRSTILTGSQGVPGAAPVNRPQARQTQIMGAL